MPTSSISSPLQSLPNPQSLPTPSKLTEPLIYSTSHNNSKKPEGPTIVLSPRPSRRMHFPFLQAACAPSSSSSTSGSFLPTPELSSSASNSREEFSINPFDSTILHHPAFSDSHNQSPNHQFLQSRGSNDYQCTSTQLVNGSNLFNRPIDDSTSSGPHENLTGTENHIRSRELDCALLNQEYHQCGRFQVHVMTVQNRRRRG